MGRRAAFQRSVATSDSCVDVRSDISRDTLDETAVASTNAETVVTKASALSYRDPVDTDISDASRSMGRSELNSVIGLSEAGDSDGASQPRLRGRSDSTQSTTGIRLTSKALDQLNASNSAEEPYNAIKRKLRKHLDKRRTGRVANVEDEVGFPSCFHTSGLYDPRMGSLEVKKSGENGGRWHIWCATCNAGALPACPQCGESLGHSMAKDASGKKKPRMMQCIACGVEVKRESIVIDPKPDCSGHYCHLKMPREMWLINPLQWGDVLAMLRGKCWWCHRWRSSSFELRRKIATLYLLNERLWNPGLEEVIDQKFSFSSTAAGQHALKKKGYNAYAASEVSKATSDMMRWVFQFIDQSEVSSPKESRPPASLMFQKRRQVVNDIWKLITSGASSKSACKNCGLFNPRRITDFKKSGFFYDVSGADMTKNIEIAETQRSLTLQPDTADGPSDFLDWVSIHKTLKAFKIDTEVNKGGGQIVHHKKNGKPMREAAPRSNVYLPPHAVKDHIEKLFSIEEDSLGQIFFQVCSSPDSVDPSFALPPSQYWKAFIHRIVEIGPNKFRPFREDNGKIQADDQTKQISNLLSCGKNLRVIGSKFMGKPKKDAPHSSNQCAVLAFWNNRPRTFEFCARSAQDSYRRIMFATATGGGPNDGPAGKGAQQIFEKKSGLFRTNLMGKRVNQACRSVISPDNNLEDDQVMLSRRFAKRLTIPEVLPQQSADVSTTQQHVLQTRRGFLLNSILNGDKTYPGATRVELDADDAAEVSKAFDLVTKARRPLFIKKPLTPEDMQLIDIARLGGKTALELILWMENVLTSCESPPDVRFKVFRHVATDDWVVLNRQPTLHKSSWLGQRLVVGSGEAGHQRTIRFHYANCKGFNADFDGDEMNIHVPQTERAQVELQVLNSARKHFISSTSGKPLRGLIQDHVVSGVLLTKRDTWLSGSEYDHLIYATLHKVSDTLPPRPEPAIRYKDKVTKKWVECWSGKQCISTLLKFVSNHFSFTGVGRYAGGLSFQSRTALPSTIWDPRPDDKKPSFITDKLMDDDYVEVIQDEFVRGLLDKNQLGATGNTLIQHCHELHGAEAAGTLLCAFGRLMTEYLSGYGFTVGITDLMLTNQKEHERSVKLHELDNAIVGMSTEADRLGTVMKKTGELNKEMFPNGMKKTFPDNCLSLMTMSGAKGSGVNSTQMAVLLGQQTFDGKRVDAMPSGKTLPGTLLGDDRAGCGGFGLGRFLSGIRPQQYVVHAAAGRDGLIDTAVKTSRSGYLQRSVVKGMEGLATKWIATSPAVIDESGGIVQFKFGHDGIDPQRSAGWKAGKAPENVTHHNIVAIQNGLAKRKREWRSVPDTDSSLKRGKPDDAVEKVDYLNHLKANMACDEPVGIIAAQSVGEPSTQMTLNTFHQAGQTVSHVTEGIPRLRQILQSASVSSPMVMLPIEGMNATIAKQILRLHVMLSPKNILDLTPEGMEPFVHSTQVSASNQNYKRVDVIVNLSETKLDDYYLGEYGLVNTTNQSSKKKKNKKDWSDINSEYRKKCEARGVMIPSKKTAAKEEDRGRCAMRLLESKPSGAVGDLHASLNSLNKAVMRDLQRSWNWDKTHDPTGFSARRSTCSGEVIPTTTLPQTYNPGHKKDSEPSQTYITSTKESTKMSLLNYDSIGGSQASEKKEAGAAALSLPETRREETYAGGLPSANNVDRPDIDNLPASEKKFLHSISLCVTPQGVCRSTENDDVLQYHFSIVVPIHINLMLDNLLKNALASVTLRKNDVAGITRAFFVPNQKGNGGMFHVEGGKIKQVVNTVYRFPSDFLTYARIDKIRSTDHNDMCSFFGVEAGQAGLLEELKRLFKSYSVDSRWLSLVTDRAMYGGSWKGFSRFSVIASSPSILSRMTFETATKFLASASKEGLHDNMKSPAARIMLGQELSQSSSNYLSMAPNTQTGKASKQRNMVVNQVGSHPEKQKVKRHKSQSPRKLKKTKSSKSKK
eukprot:TRINITY_DN2297_c0_g2_i1.p1 TRINITY_DN2297_c0_g2~~TRINITY_DN2297_c0_g2_i1.p1  ORF type:complete len:2044 (+),score=401.74 TRINITY_DN2297_c0_g2_i1:222-6134(+)